MKEKNTVPEVMSICKDIQEQPENIFKMIRIEIKESIGSYQSKLMDMELTHFFGRKRYEHDQGDVNHRNGSYACNFILKGIGEVQVEVSGDRKGEFEIQVLP
ncbi:MAG: transposase [Thermodesulfobacteriota bacterium]|nr:transposase [Thermodesulfobacteriota bacterium]